ncbi:DNA-3-methyladenine glycosylase [Alicyclobacillus fastidiosus]|uniref:DNA-3-methyladenine glycosylase II n=1 Tax=Alicyclobacillus fastidiosus TaxID=392011 RepID=A0ABY6ZM26_9BACL|nr:DNA-3-methyladenine glycosylase [Alicyclobacillus fastidiosus]WAH43887.1 DNA-3-methyladenine glycosylase [Alicyclobacillus fastidiosus]GMA60129.1 DNA-3-methyladenine glycosylase II [Alicyclobacillus fastidiosus]
MNTLRLELPDSFDFSLSIERNVFGIGELQVVQTDAGPVVYRALWRQGEPVATKVCVERHQSTLLVETADALSLEEARDVESQIRHWLDLDSDYARIRDYFGADTTIRPVVDSLSGLHLQRDIHPFAALVRMMIGQQVNVAFATTLTNRLIHLAGRYVVWDGMTIPVFPMASEVAAVSVDELRRLQFSSRKAEYIVQLARMVDDGSIDLSADHLQTMDDDQVVEYLCKIRGVGQWSAQCCLLFALGRPDVFPALDIGLLDALARLYGVARPSAKEAARMVEKWSPYRSYAAHFLWCGRRMLGKG